MYCLFFIYHLINVSQHVTDVHFDDTKFARLIKHGKSKKCKK